MQKLRNLHLYLGCIFAPILIFLAVSGIWQTFGWHHKGNSSLLARLSSIHTSQMLKLKVGSQAPQDFTSAAMRWFVLAAATAFIVTTVVGIVMAFKFSRSRRAAVYCLVAGVLIPLLLILIRLIA